MNTIVLFSTRVGVEARLYSETGVTFFRGTGETDAEAIGALICHCPEKFNCKFEIVANEIEAVEKGISMINTSQDNL